MFDDDSALAEVGAIRDALYTGKYELAITKAEAALQDEDLQMSIRRDIELLKARTKAAALKMDELKHKALDAASLEQVFACIAVATNDHVSSGRRAQAVSQLSGRLPFQAKLWSELALAGLKPDGSLPEKCSDLGEIDAAASQALASQHPDLVYQAMMLFLKAERHDLAVEQQGKLASLSEEAILPILSQVFADCCRGKWQHASSALEDLDFVSDTFIRDLKAFTRLHQGEFTQAIADYGSKDNYVSLVNLACAYANNKQFELANQTAQKIMQCCSDNHPFRDVLQSLEQAAKTALVNP